MGRAEYMFKIVIVVRCLESQRPPKSRLARNTPLTPPICVVHRVTQTWARRAY